MQWSLSKSTPIYFFSSVKPDSGKSTILSNLAVYLNSLGYKIAVIDLDFAFPKKLINAFSNFKEKKEYEELTSLVKAIAPRFQQNFQFSETNKLSFFPAHNIKNPIDLLTDTALKDFFLQLINIFDYILINLSTGLNESLKVSDLLSKSYLLQGCKVASLIISLSEKRSLINLDSLIQNNQVLSYQAEENTYFVFNKAEDPYDDIRKKSDSLSISALRSVFTYPLTYIIPSISEIKEQQNNHTSYVLEKDSRTNQNIVGLFRLLSGSASINYLIREANTYHSCISGSLLSRIYPYLEKIQQKIAAKLFINPEDVNLYVEQNEQNFRIRIRLTSLGQKLLPIRGDIPEYQKLTISKDEQLYKIDYPNIIDKFRAVEQMDRDTPYTLSFKSVFTFDDSFYSKPVAAVNKNIPIEPIKESFPSPIILGFSTRIPEIPTLSNILGLLGQRKFILFSDISDEINKKGVSPVYIPTEFPLSNNSELKEKTTYFYNNSFTKATPDIKNKIELHKGYSYVSKSIEPHKIFDIFARNKKFSFISNFGIKPDIFEYIYDGFESLPTGKFSLLNENLIISKIVLPELKDNTSSISDIALSKYKMELDKENILESIFTWNFNNKKRCIESPKSYAHSFISHTAIGFYPHNLDLNLFKFSNVINIKPIKVADKIATNTLFNYISKTENKNIPKAYNLSSPFKAFKEGFLSKNFRPLPVSLSLEDVMLDYNYIIQVIDDYVEFVFDTNISKGLEFKPKLSCKFEHKYMEPDLLIRRRYSYKRPIMYQLFKLGKLKVSNKVIVSKTDYRIAYNEIFPIIYIPKAIEIPITKNYKQPEWNDYRNDNNIAKPSFKIQIRPLKLINNEKAPYNTELPPLKFNYFCFFEPRIKIYEVSIKVAAPKKPKFQKDYLEYKTLPLLGSNSIRHIPIESFIELKNDSNTNIDSTFDSEIDKPKIFTEKIRHKSEKFISFNWKDPSISIITFETSIHQRTPLKIQTLIHHNDILDDKIHLFQTAKYPLRIKKVKLINNFTNLSNYKPVFNYSFDFTNDIMKIFILRDRKDFKDNNFVQKPFEQKYIEPKIISKYILKKLATKLPNPKIGRGKFFVIPEKPDEILYKHLLWEFSNESGPILCEYKNTDLKNETLNVNNSFDTNYKFKPLLGEIEFKPHEDITLRLNKVFTRDKYKIRNNHVKDLLALAKAQAAKASIMVNS